MYSLYHAKVKIFHLSTLKAVFCVLDSSLKFTLSKCISLWGEAGKTRPINSMHFSCLTKALMTQASAEALHYEQERLFLSDMDHLSAVLRKGMITGSDLSGYVNVVSLSVRREQLPIFREKTVQINDLFLGKRNRGLAR